MKSRTTKKSEYVPGKIRDLVERVAQYTAKHPEIVNDLSTLHAVIASALPEYKDKKECFNCGQHMKITVYTAGIIDALLLIAMAKEVRRNMDKDMVFTMANRVHVPTLPASDAVRHTITRAAYLGLVAQSAKTKNSGYWVITHWGWKALRGEMIPKSAKYWRGKLLERSVEMTTLSGMFKTHVDSVDRAVARRKQVRADHRGDIERWNPQDWVEYGVPIDQAIPSSETVGSSHATLAI